MSEDYADETLKTVVSWGRYAELFAYDEQSETFSLENPGESGDAQNNSATPETNSSASTILRNVPSSIRPNSFSPSHVPANRNGRPSANSFAV